MKRLLLLLILLHPAVARSAVPAPAPPDEVLVQQFLQVEPVPADGSKPWYSPDNLSIAGGLSYGWWAGGDAITLSPRKEWVVGLYNAWQLTEHVDAILNVEYGVDTKIRGFKLGARGILKAPK